MAKLLKLRRGTTTQHGSFTGAEGEVTIDTTKDTAVIHDGSQAGGRPLLREDMANLPAGTIDNADVNVSAAISGTKISPDFGSQDITTTGKIKFANVYSQEADLPSASTYHGMFAHVHATGLAYYAHGGNWIKLAKLDAPDFTGGIDVTGNVTCDGIRMGDSDEIRLGTSDDLRIFHDSNNSFIKDTGTGRLSILTNQLRVNNAADSEVMISATENGSVELYFDGTQKLNTNGSGINVSGNIAVSGTVDGRDVAADGTLLNGLTYTNQLLKDGVAATTQSQSDNTTKVSTTAYVRTAISEAQAFPSGTKMIFQQTSAPTGWTKITTDNNKALRLVNGTVSSGGNQSFTSAFASRTPAGNVGSSGNSTASFSGSVSGNTGNSGASTSNVSTGGNVNNHTLSNNQMPSHSHSFNMRHVDFYESQQDVQKTFSGANNAGNKGTNNSGGSGAHSHGFSGSSHSHNVNNHTHSFSGNFSGNTGNHTHNSGGFSGTALDFAVQYLDVIICSKN